MNEIRRRKKPSSCFLRYFSFFFFFSFSEDRALGGIRLFPLHQPLSFQRTKVLEERNGSQYLYFSMEKQRVQIPPNFDMYSYSFHIMKSLRSETTIAYDH